MCLSPITIKNPNFRQKHYPLFADNISSKLQVPCGHCKECVSLKQTYIIQRVQMLSEDYHLFMLTLTYNSEHVPKVDINGYRHLYADFTHWQKMIKRMRKYNTLGVPFKYLVVSEYGGKRHRPHYHAIIFVKKELIKRPFEWSITHFYDFYNNWSINVSTPRKPVFELLSTWKRSSDGRRTYDFHWVNPYLIVNGKPLQESSVAFYVTKYVMKFDKWLDRKRKALRMSLDDEEYNYYWHLLRPHCHFSHDFFPDKIITRKNAVAVPERYAPFLRIMEDTIKLASVHKNFVFCYRGKSFPLAPYLREYLRPLPRYGSTWTLGHFYADDPPFSALDIYEDLNQDIVSYDDLLREGCVDAVLVYDRFAKRFNETYDRMIAALSQAKANPTGCLGYIESRSDSELESARRSAERFYNRHCSLSQDYSNDDMSYSDDFVINESEYEAYEYIRLHPRNPSTDFRECVQQLKLFEDNF